MHTTQERKEDLERKIVNDRMRLLGVMFSPRVQLNEEEQERYDSIKNMERKGPIPEYIPSYKNERDYLIKYLNSQIEISEGLLTQLVCDEKGHVESKKRYAQGEVYATCKRCKINYTKDRGALEVMEYEKSIK